MSISLGHIPIVDFAPFTQGDAADKQRVVDQIYAACHDIGFMYLQNCGIRQSLFNRLLDESKQFFDLPEAVKAQMARSEQTNCGYIGFQKERLNVGLKSVWLPDQEAFCNVVSEFYHRGTTIVAPNILRAFAIALGQPETFFDDKHGQNYFLRILHYPPINQTPEPGQLRAGEHSDYGSITLLLQDEVGGLEVCTRQGDWIAAPPIPGTIVVNVGDAMQRWTNDRLSSTLHRVSLPVGAGWKRDRYSIALFCDPNPDVELACLESCITSDQPSRYPSIVMQDYLSRRLAATY